MDQVCGFFVPGENDKNGRAVNLTPNDDDGTGGAAVVDDDDESAMSPFIAYDDGYIFPDLHTELDEMLEANILIYPLAELRKMVRAGQITDADADMILQIPLTHRQVVDVVMANRSKLTESQFGKEFYMDVLKTAEERHMIQIETMNGADTAETDESDREVTDETPTPSSSDPNNRLTRVTSNGSSHMGSQHSVRLSPSTIIAFDDEYANEELVYCIEVNHVRKRITICFRGSVTKTDWATNMEIYMKDVSNPMKAHSSQDPVIRVHHGFYNFLFQVSSKGAKGPSGEDLSEYQEILQEHLLPVIKEYPGYKLYVTGHSLGAALATLFAVEAAALPDSVIPKPVSLFSIAGPYVGDDSFREAHRLLEGLGKLRHLRLSNHKDIVTIVPKMAFRWKFYEPGSHVGSLFKHVGMNLRLFDTTAPFEISYPKVKSGAVTSALDEMTRGWDQSIFFNFDWNPVSYFKWPWHSLREYNKRLENNKPLLETIHLNDLYSRNDIVGWLVPSF